MKMVTSEQHFFRFTICILWIGRVGGSRVLDKKCKGLSYLGSAAI
jgi:hypothetical protein